MKRKTDGPKRPAAERKKREFDPDALASLLGDLGEDSAQGESRDVPAAPARAKAAKPDRDTRSPARGSVHSGPRDGRGKSNQSTGVTHGKTEKPAQAARAPSPPQAQAGTGRRTTGAQLKAALAKTRAKLTVTPEEQARPPAGTPAAVSGKESLPAHPTGEHGLQYVDKDGNVLPGHHPKKHLPGTLQRGQRVWYRGEGYFIEYAPSTWVKGCYVRISQARVHPDRSIRSGTDLAYIDEKGQGRNAPFPSFCVHADLLDLAPQAKTIYGPQPTLASAARKERAAKGERDVGDEVAVLLRGASSLDDVYRIGSEYLGVPEPELRAKYGHLNPGQQRMNIGNRMRAKWRKDNGHS